MPRTRPEPSPTRTSSPMRVGREVISESTKAGWKTVMRVAVLPVLLIATVLLMSSAGVAASDEVKVGDLTISGLWTRATPPKAPSAGGYLTIANAGKDADRLVEVSSAVAGKAELHEMAMKKGVMTMRPVEAGVPIPPGGKVDLTPDGLHIMFTELKQSLKVGDKVPVTLT